MSGKETKPAPSHKEMVYREQNGGIYKVLVAIGVLCLVVAGILGIIFIVRFNETHFTPRGPHETPASDLTNAVKNLYAGVTSGQINKDTPADELHDLDASKLPAANATVAECKECANNLTVQDAIDYGGLAGSSTEKNISDFVYDTVDGTIYSKERHEGGIPLTLETTLGEICRERAG